MRSFVNLTKEIHAHFWIWFNLFQILSYLLVAIQKFKDQEI